MSDLEKLFVFYNRFSNISWCKDHVWTSKTEACNSKGTSRKKKKKNYLVWTFKQSKAACHLCQSDSDWRNVFPSLGRYPPDPVTELQCTLPTLLYMWCKVTLSIIHDSLHNMSPNPKIFFLPLSLSTVKTRYAQSRKIVFNCSSYHNFLYFFFLYHITYFFSSFSFYHVL